MRRLWGIAGLLLGLGLLLSGCAGGQAAQVSWPGATLDKGTLYIADVSQVKALDAANGTLLWSYPEKESAEIGFYSTPVLDKERNRLLVAGFKDRTVYALQLADSPTTVPGTAWTFKEALGQYVGSGAIAGNLFIIGNGDGDVYALDLATGAKVWTFSTQDRVWATPVVVDSLVYIASLDHHLYALDMEGKLVWDRELAGAVGATPVVVGDALWVGDFGDKMHQLDLKTGEERFTFTAKNWIWATPVVDGDRIYFSDVVGNVYAMDTANPSQEPLWQTDLGDTLHGRAVLVTINDESALLIPGDKLGKIFAVSAETGQQLSWGVILESPGNLPGDLVTDGTAVFSMPILIRERVRAFDVTSGKLLWQYPTPEPTN